MIEKLRYFTIRLISFWDETLFGTAGYCISVCGKKKCIFHVHTGHMLYCHRGLSYNTVDIRNADNSYTCVIFNLYSLDWIG